MQSVRACGEDIQILESFSYLGSVVHNSGGSRPEAYGGLLWTRSTRAYGIVDNCAEGQRFPSGRFSSLPYSTAVRHEHLTANNLEAT